MLRNTEKGLHWRSSMLAHDTNGFYDDDDVENAMRTLSWWFRSQLCFTDPAGSTLLSNVCSTNAHSCFINSFALYLQWDSNQEEKRHCILFFKCRIYTI